MRHGRKLNHLGRTSAHRKSLLANLASALIKHKRITTTLAKAKALQRFVEPLITKAKDDTTHSRRIVFSNIKDKESITELFREISVKIASRPGGYTRVIKMGARQGDAAEMAIIELVDYNEIYVKETKAAAKKTTRRSTAKKKADAPVAKVETTEAETKAE